MGGEAAAIGGATVGGVTGLGTPAGIAPAFIPRNGGALATGGAPEIGGTPRMGGGPATTCGPVVGGGGTRATGGGPLEGAAQGAGARAIGGAPGVACGATTTTLSQPGQRVSRPIIELSICDIAPQRGQPKTTSGIPRLFQVCRSANNT